jgi:hypothetical protein
VDHTRRQAENSGGSATPQMLTRTVHLFVELDDYVSTYSFKIAATKTISYFPLPPQTKRLVVSLPPQGCEETPHFHRRDSHCKSFHCDTHEPILH